MKTSIIKKLNIDTKKLIEICKESNVKNLYVFGSIRNGNSFKKGKSDIDFLVEFEEVTFDNYFNLVGYS